MAGVMIAASFVGSAAAQDDVKEKVTTAAVVPSLAGRWTGHYYSYDHRGDPACDEKGCALTYDIVACKDGWCGIAVTNEKTCGAVGFRLAAADNRPANVFRGKFEVAKGSQAYTVEASTHSADDPAQRLDFVGDTGPELRLFRRSYPFHANFVRAGDAICTLEKATS
ncbi:hypothetical protein DLM45_16270 [Hyphomicrobium methylovorum]|uniref:hypothetical protein n=1 Tax=Hyphomicrobium methylovorum TaxID=84 RepID=UPI0015E7A126|nr:hypothetical protein [Hyphomicrobium methylovorum]MBA2127768.1 hypothetical protein [Hyphomicrobium methylovorum]